MKKVIVGMVLLLVLLMGFMGTTYATGSLKVTASKTELSKKDEVVIEVKISGITTNLGIGAFSTVLEYDKESLTYKKMEGQNGWSTQPTYNSKNGRIVMDKGSDITSGESVLKITFEVKDSAKENFRVALKNTMISDGEEDISVSGASIGLKLKQENLKNNNENQGNSQKPENNKDNQENDQKTVNSNQESNNKKTTNSNKNQKNNNDNVKNNNSNLENDDENLENNEQEEENNEIEQENINQELNESPINMEDNTNIVEKTEKTDKAGKNNTLIVIVVLVVCVLVVGLYMKVRAKKTKRSRRAK